MLKRTPDGVRDALPEETARQRQAEEAVGRRFQRCGYRELSPPILEYFSLYDSLAPQALVKTFDKRGGILALRPDLTTSIARIASTSMKDARRPLRLYYLGRAFSNQYDRPGKSLEFTQAGVELIGLDGPEADAEVIALAASAMAEAGLKDFLIDVGQVDFFKGLMEEMGIAGEDAEGLRQSVEEKNVLEMEMRLARMNLSGKALERVMTLPMLYGGLEVLDEAAGLSDHPRSLAALKNVRAVYETLCAYGLEKHISIDLGLVHEIEYYTGIVFRGITSSLGVAILSGGRYDNLSGDGTEAATGFALGVERLLDALERQNAKQTVKPPVDIVAGWEGNLTREILIKIETFRESGKRVELFYGDSDTELSQRAAEFSARAVRFAGEAVRWL